MTKFQHMPDLRGFIGVSRGDTNLNAIVYDPSDGEFYFYVVTPEQANALEDWNIESGDEDDLLDILPDLSDEDLDMFLYGEIID